MNTWCNIAYETRAHCTTACMRAQHIRAPVLHHDGLPHPSRLALDATPPFHARLVLVNVMWPMVMSPIVIESNASDSQLLTWINSETVFKAARNGVTPLHLAVIEGNTAIVTRLLAANTALVNYASLDFNAPLHLACGPKGNIDIVTALLAAGAAVDQVDVDDDTPLHLASGCNPTVSDRNEIVSALLTAGAAVNLPNNDGDTPLCLACRTGYDKVVTSLLAARAMPNEAPDCLISACAFAGSAVDDDGCDRNLKNVVALLKAGAAVNLASGDEGGTALHAASCKECIEVLLNARALVDEVDNSGRTPANTAGSKNDVGVRRESALALCFVGNHADLSCTR